MSERDLTRQGSSRLAPAEAGGADRHLGAGQGQSSRALISGASTVSPRRRQAFVQAVQAPDVVGMLAGAASLPS